jgi:hypothetical protein
VHGSCLRAVKKRVGSPLPFEPGPTKAHRRGYRAAATAVELVIEAIKIPSKITRSNTQRNARLASCREACHGSSNRWFGQRSGDWDPPASRDAKPLGLADCKHLCCSAYAIALNRLLRLDSGWSVGDHPRAYVRRRVKRRICAGGPVSISVDTASHRK